MQGHHLSLTALCPLRAPVPESHFHGGCAGDLPLQRWPLVAPGMALESGGYAVYLQDAAWQGSACFTPEVGCSNGDLRKLLF